MLGFLGTLILGLLGCTLLKLLHPVSRSTSHIKGPLIANQQPQLVSQKILPKLSAILEIQPCHAVRWFKSHVPTDHKLMRNPKQEPPHWVQSTLRTMQDKDKLLSDYIWGGLLLLWAELYPLQNLHSELLTSHTSECYHIGDMVLQK